MYNMVKEYDSIPAAVRDLFGETAYIIRRDRLHGGDINDAYCLTLSTGEKVFLKTNSVGNIRFFVTEAHGLAALGTAGKIRVPEVLGLGVDRTEGVSFLLLSYLVSAPRISDYWEVFGRQLAELHRAGCPQFEGNPEAKYGFSEDNFIGANPQKNSPREGWVDFYRDCRLLPQIRMADSWFSPAVKRKFIRFLDHLDSYLKEPDFPSVLHGDLWSGNAFCGSDGRAWLIDPAAYVGDFETDLAMTQLFGSFPPVFYAAYSEVNPIGPGYRERRDLYQLYHLLNHLNLFGGSYLGSVVGILRKY